MKKRISTALLVYNLAVPFCSSLTHAQAVSHSGEATPHAVLVELFTSEGCSSCPPADALLRQVNGTKTSDGQLIVGIIVGISEHVTYWNGLGWSDPFSSELYTSRQNAYGNRFRLGSVYTPQMVVNGAEEFVGSSREGLQRALQQESARPQMPLHILSAKAANQMLEISFDSGAAATAGGVEVMAALTDDTDQSSVQHGENTGRTLTHVSVARYLMRVALVHGPSEKTVRVPLPNGMDLSKGGHHLILFAQSTGLGPVLGIDARVI